MRTLPCFNALDLCLKGIMFVKYFIKLHLTLLNVFLYFLTEDDYYRQKHMHCMEKRCGDILFSSIGERLSAKYGVYLPVVIVTKDKCYTHEPKCSAFTFYTNQSIDYVNRINVRRKIMVFPLNSVGKFCYVSE